MKKKTTKLTIKKFVKSGSFWTINKKLVETLGFEESLFLTNLIETREFSKTIDDDWFFNTLADIKLETGLSPHKQRKFTKDLKKKKLIETRMMGFPQRRYFKIKDENILKILKDKVI